MKVYSIIYLFVVRLYDFVHILKFINNITLKNSSRDKFQTKTKLILNAMWPLEISEAGIL